MIQFFAPQNFILFWSIPALVILFLLAARIRRKRLSLIGHIPTLEQKLMPYSSHSEKSLRAACLILVFLFAVLALARPQWGEEKKKVERKGVDVIFMLDTSLSMLAEDIKPSRFEKSKLEIRDVLARMKGDRVGMVAFAGSSFLQSPLTLDYSAFQLFLDAIKVGYIPDPGTSLDRALKLAIRSFPGKETKHKAVILLTDGEDHEGGIESALEEAKKTGLRIYTIGVGTPQGEPIPLRDENGKKSGFKKDFSGQVVVTKLNQPLLEKIAGETGGIFLPSTPGQQEIDILLKHMQSLGKKHFKEKIVTEREDHYQVFLILAFLFLILEMFVRARSANKPKSSSAKNGASPNLSALFAGAFLMLGFCGTLWAKDPVKLYEEKKYQSAMEEYRKKKVKDPDDPAVRYNLGTTLYQIDNFSDASKELEKTVAAAKDPALKAKAYYNYGNTQYRLGNFEKAIESYKKALELNPEDKDSKYNLEFLQKKKSSFEKKDQERQNQKQDQQQKQQDKHQDQQQQQNQNQQQQNQQNQQQDQQQQNQNQQQQNQQQNQNQQGQQDSDQQNQDQQDQQQQQNQQNPEQDPQSQDQQNQQQEQQDKQEQQNQQQQDQQQKDQQDQQEQENQQQQGQENQQDQQDQQDQKEQDKQQEQGDQEKEQQDQPSQENPQEQEQPESGEEEPAEMQPEGMSGEEPLPASQLPGTQQGKKPLQGQMSLENALQILEALKEGERELHDLRKPGPGREQARVIKDW